MQYGTLLMPGMTPIGGGSPSYVTVPVIVAVPSDFTSAIFTPSAVGVPLVGTSPSSLRSSELAAPQPRVKQTASAGKDMYRSRPIINIPLTSLTAVTAT